MSKDNEKAVITTIDSGPLLELYADLSNRHDSYTELLRDKDKDLKYFKKCRRELIKSQREERRVLEDKHTSQLQHLDDSIEDCQRLRRRFVDAVSIADIVMTLAQTHLNESPDELLQRALTDRSTEKK